MTLIADSLPGRPARRREIVEAARAIAAEQGWPAVTVRAIGSRIGCSAPAIYQYFRDKEAVLEALAADGNQRLTAALDRAVDGLHGPVKRLRAVVRAVWDFALANREVYVVMCGLDGLTAHTNGGSTAGTPDILRHIAGDLVDKGRVAGAAEDVADSIAAVLHGFLCLTLTDRFPGGRDRALALLTGTVEALVK